MKKTMKRTAKKWISAALLCLCLGLMAGTVSAQAGTVKNATVKKVGKKYYGYKKNGKKIKKKWAIVKSGKKKYKYYFGKNGVAYTGVRAIGKTAFDTKLYYFNKKGRLQTSKTNTLQKLSAEGAELKPLQDKIKKLDKKNSFKEYINSAEFCGATFCKYKNFSIYFKVEDGKKLVEYVGLD